MKNLKLTIGLLFTSFCVLNAQGIWTQKADFGGAVRSSAVGFAVGTKGYIGTGLSQGPRGRPYNDFWEWDQTTNMWTQKANFGGGQRQSATGFSIGTKAYIGMGLDTFGRPQKDFWEWDQATNIWTKKADFGGIARGDAVGFSIGNKGYIGTGAGDTSLFNDFWEWDQATNVWTKMASFPGTARVGAVSFSIGTKGYIGTGAGAGVTHPTDFWEWDQTTNIWTRKADFSGGSAVYAKGFSIDTNGYLVTGWSNFWEWNQSTNIWVQKANFPGTATVWPIAFSIGNKGYTGTGQDINTYQICYNDFWEFDPASITGIKESEFYIGMAVYPDPANSSVTIQYNSSVIDELFINIKNEQGQRIYSEDNKQFSGKYLKTVDLSSQPKGVYFVEILCANKRQGKTIVLQ